MKKNLSYRDQLLELSNIYKILEIKNYIKNKKYLTTAQLEHILKKNKVPIPKEINKNITDIYLKKIAKSFSKVKDSIVNSTNFIKISVIKYLFYKPINTVQNIFSLFLKKINDFLSFVSKKTIDTLNTSYNFKVENRKENKVVFGAILATFLFLLVLGGVQVKGLFLEKKSIQADLKSEKKIDNLLSKKQLELKNPKVIKKKIIKPKEKVVKLEEKKENLQTEKNVEKRPNVVKEFVLPDLNLKTETILSLFADVKYDLNKVRDEKRVKPIYFTQFPKDLDEIMSVKLKKETFIKIVLPLVVAENQKILDDKRKLKEISSRKMTTDKEKLWLRQKLKEYKVTKGNISELTKRIDIVPVSIAIAQAAKESGWGTSRFALEGNAIFGQWTWNGQGIAPIERAAGKNHKILRFPILRASVKAYQNNLNTHKSYREFRDKRSKLRSRNNSLVGIKLIHTLDSYAETGIEYTKILKQIIEQNNLSDFENVRLANTVTKAELNL